MSQVFLYKNTSPFARSNRPLQFLNPMDYDDRTNDRSCLSLDLCFGPRTSPVNVPTPARPTNFSLSTQVDSSFGQQSFSRKEDSLEAQLNKVSEENRRLTEIVAALSRNRHGAARWRSESFDFENGSSSPKRKWIVDCAKDEDAWKRLKSVTDDPAAKTFKICVRTDQNDSNNVVKDGYRWRKYGQKVTRDSPFP
ncbi:WRKY transcription factor WRKY76-like [Zingiber officinale]|uniref:WRKY transcription factor WRKY76-like n=1 Tax=Zingiber officinale TaxID=94328 RepID=UPI001C4CE43B|nr:WRKY transcription factor WRKY76-like [Zingiber officinale]